MNLFQEFQRWKLHPKIRAVLEGGTCLQYGARSALADGYCMSGRVQSCRDSMLSKADNLWFTQAMVCASHSSKEAVCFPQPVVLCYDRAGHPGNMFATGTAQSREHVTPASCAWDRGSRSRRWQPALHVQPLAKGLRSSCPI